MFSEIEQQMMDRIEAMEARIATLEAGNKVLEIQVVTLSTANQILEDKVQRLEAEAKEHLTTEDAIALQDEIAELQTRQEEIEQQVQSQAGINTSINTPAEARYESNLTHRQPQAATSSAPEGEETYSPPRVPTSIRRVNADALSPLRQRSRTARTRGEREGP